MLEWDDQGQPLAMFTPDFYLPDDNEYIEVTTMSQKLVTKKNRKVRMLRRAHPGIRCKVLYQRDYLHLVVKYGLEAPDQMDEIEVLPTRIPGPPSIELPGEMEDTA